MVKTTNREQRSEGVVTQKQITSYFSVNISPGREEPRTVTSIEEPRNLVHIWKRQRLLEYHRGWKKEEKRRKGRKQKLR